MDRDSARLRQALRADGLLGLTAMLWGFAFVAQKAGMDHVGPFTFNAIRFALGALVLLGWIGIRGRQAGQPALKAGLLAGVVLFVGASLQQVGVVETTAGKAGFITGLYVLMVPLLGLCWGERPPWLTWIGVLLAVVGMYLLSVKGDMTIASGDLLVCASALFFALHVISIGWLAPRCDPLRLAAVQFATVSLLSLLVAAAREPILLDGVVAARWSILYGGVLSVGVAYTLQVVAQRDAPPAHAAIIMSLESVFAAIGGWLILSERIGPRGLAGCALMVSGMIFSQLVSARQVRSGD